MAQQRLFAIVSWGAAATGWLARVLNSHPDIFCVHAANYAMHFRLGIERPDGVPYMQTVAHMGDHYPIAGDVHGVSRDTIPALREALGATFECAVIVRDPIARLKSQLGLFHEFGFSRWGDLEALRSIAEGFGYEWDALSIEQKHHFHGVNMLNAIIDEAPIARVFRMEDIVASSAGLLDLTNHVTGGGAAVTEEWATAALAIAPLNRHAAGFALDPWTEQALARVVQPAAWVEYEKLGYQRPPP